MNVDIDSIKRKLLVKYPFFGSIVANAKFLDEPTIGTAATDGENIIYSPEFISGLNEDEQVFVFAHEVCHIAFNHIFRSEGKDKYLWNVATDSVINAFLKHDGLPLFKGAVNKPEAINYDAEEMYNKLLEEEKNNSKDKKSKQDNKQTNSVNDSSLKSNENEQNHDVGHDSHGLWENATKRKKESSANNNNNQNNQQKEQQQQETKKEKRSLFDRIFNKNKTEKTNLEEKKEENSQISNQNQDQNNKEKQVRKITELGEKKAFKQNKIERKKQLEELRKSLIEQSHSMGSDSNSNVRKVDNIGVASPLIDWRKLLKEATKLDVDWSYKNASIEDGLVTPYLEEIPKPDTEIVLDTSGSINEILLRNFLRECKNILQTSRLKVGCFDTKFYGFTEIKDESDIDNLPFIGGGGTSFEAAVNAFSNRVENKIIFTDGAAPVPPKPLRAIWIVFGNTKIQPIGGKVIYISDEQLKRLNSSENNNYYKGRSR